MYIHKTLLVILITIFLTGCGNTTDEKEILPQTEPLSIEQTGTDESNTTQNDQNITQPLHETNSTAQEQNRTTPSSPNYPLHENITATLFWIGENESPDNHQITNVESAWDDNWLKHYGGVDTPERTTLLPTFKPNENPFYFALPYSDFDDNGNRREDAIKVIPWANEKTWKDDESMVKNRWIKIEANGKTAYAQWEDAGPFEYDDTAYVFGTSAPKSSYNNHAGLDLSPAVWIYLGFDTRNMDNQAKMNWQFVNREDVPNGPWMEVVTYRQVSWQ